MLVVIKVVLQIVNWEQETLKNANLMFFSGPFSV